MTPSPLTRRTFLKATLAGGAIAGAPRPLRAQPKPFRIAAVHPVTGPLAEPGQTCRLGAQLAVEAVNAGGGIKSKGGMPLELLLGDTQSKPENGRIEAERLVNQGAQMLLGSFDSGSTAAMVSVAQQKRVPFLIDIAAADPITANVARSVKEGQQKVQYVYRNFPTGSSFGRKAVQYFTEIFAEANVTPKRVLLMYCNDLFGQSQLRRFLAAYKAARPAWTLLPDAVIADVLERAATLDDPDAIVDALKKTHYTGGLMQYAGPIHFNELGDNPNAVTTMTQILGQKAVAVWPKEAALQKFVFPRPRG